MLSLLGLTGLASVGLAQSSVSLAWNAVPSPNIASYNLYYGGASQSYTNVASAGSATNVTVNGLTRGATYHFAVTSVDSTGMESVYSPEISYSVPLAPTIVLTAPANGGNYTAPANITLQANVTANGHTINQVQFFSGSTLLGTDTSAPYSLAWNNVAAGTYSLTAQLTYDGGSKITTAAATVTVSASGGSGQSSISLAWNAVPSPNIVGYNLYYGGASQSYTNVVSAGAATNVAVSGLTRGATYYFAVTSLDSVGMESTYSQEISYTVGSSNTTTPPVIALAAPANGASYTAPANITLQANVTANGHTIAQVQFFNGSTLLGTDTAAPYTLAWNNVAVGTYSLTAKLTYDGGSTITSAGATVTVSASGGSGQASVSLAWNAVSSPNVASYNLYYGGASQTYTNVVSAGSATNFAVNGLTRGATYYFAATSVDSVGMESVYSQEISYTVPLTNTTTPPAIALAAPADGASYAAPANINLQANVTTNGHTINQVQFFNGSTLLGTDTSAPYTLAWNNVAAGTYSLTAQVTYDGSSTIASTTVTVTVTNTPTPPAIVLGSPANGASYAAPANISLLANVTANGHTINQVQFFNGSTVLGADTSAPYSLAWNNVAAGTYSLTAQLTYDGGSTIKTAPVTVTVTNPPAAPVIVLASPTNGASYTAPTNISIQANVTPNGHTISQVQFFNGSALLGTATSAPYSLVWSNVSSGNYSLTAQAVYDSGSNVTSAVVNVTVTGLPAPWQTVDIGTVGVTGSALCSNGLYTVSGAGNASGGSDNFRFVYQTLTGDGEIRGQISSDQAGGGVVGAMIRESLTSGSRNAFMGITPNGSFRWQRRTNTGGNTFTSKSGSGTLPAVWVRVVRTGNRLSGYTSADGVNWTLVNSATISMASNIYIGLAVASGSTSTLGTATFTNITAVP